MIFKKPYGFLIKHFKLIHLILTGIYIYLVIKVNSVLKYYNNFSSGIASKLDAIKYVTSYYMIAIFLSILICLVVYFLMRYKKKPRVLYLVLIGFYVVVAWMIQYSYQGLDTIYISILDAKSLRLYQDLLRILILFQYLSIGVVLVRGLGFDIKKFNFVHDLEELDIDVSDEEEVELTLGSTNSVWRKLRRKVRELKYYYFENRVFINIILVIVIVFGIMFWFLDHEVIHKEYRQNQIFSSDQFTFQVLASYVTNKGYDNQGVLSNDSSFVIVRMNISSNSEAKKLNTSNLVLKVNYHSYTSESKYAARFTDLGSSYRNQSIDTEVTYLFIFQVSNDDLDGKMRIVYAEDKTVYLSPVFLDEVSDAHNYQLGESIDLSNSSLGSGSVQIQSFEVQEQFSYPYQYEIGGEIYTNQLSITSVQNVILHLSMEASYPYGLTMYSFLEKYATLHYKVEDQEYVSSVLGDKTPGSYKEGLYLSVDKQVMNATNIWFDIKIRNLEYIYTLK